MSKLWAKYDPPMPPNYDPRIEEIKFQEWFKTQQATQKSYQKAPSYHELLRAGNRATNQPAP
jgi:hypothetical protein